ncbi:MAG TPA: diguanylate cyclase, partial [Rhodocyclaceae bacterium]|nr:diguanylate cyclase [Rhodocyclaceae bacterium]
MLIRFSALKFALLAAVVWTLALSVSLGWNLHNARSQVMDMIYAEVRANLNKDLTFRRWGTRHGGVYVPLTESQPSVPWLAHVPGRDVETTDGRRLTLLNPASMLRQMMDDYSEAYGIRGRITGLKVLNPGNAPDAWEKTQLESFARGEKKEVWEIAALDGKPQLRYLRAMFMEPGCMKCHAILGYQVGEMRGATGLNLPLEPYYQRIDASSRNLGLTHGAIWLLGVLGIGLAGRQVQRRMRGEIEAQALRDRAEARYRILFEQARDGIVLIDPDTQYFVEFNAVAHEQLGYSREEFAVLRWQDIEAEATPQDMKRRIESVCERGWDNFETRHRRKDGRLRYIQMVVQLLVLDGRSLLQATCRDITERKEAEGALLLYASLFQHSGEAILVTDADNRIVAANTAFTRLSGYSCEEMLGEDPKVLSAGRTAPEVHQDMWAALLEKGFWQGELWDRRKDGSVFPKWATISAIRDSAGTIGNYITIYTDISERKAAQQRIEHLAHHDILTGLCNRYNLDHRLNQELSSARRHGGSLAVLFIDMDRFKEINDTYGHAVGDRLLVEVARRLRLSVRESDIVARLGGDEFVVVVTGMEAALDAAAVADKILHALGQSYEIDGRALHSTPSIGVGIFPEDGDSHEALMRCADLAMYCAKQQGRNT